MMEAAHKTGWIDRLSLWQRVALLFATAIMGLFLAGFFVGFGMASYEHGHLLPRKPIGWLALGVAVGLSLVVYRMVRALLAKSWTQGMTPFDQRYAKMLLIIVLLGAPLGAGLAFATLDGDPRDAVERIFLNGALSPTGAILLSAALAVLLGIAVILYHRAIDDHEERAYLWASQIAYYFLAIIIPIFWLLSRGGLVPALTAGGAMLMLLASFVIQGAVWAWFKFR